MRFRGRSGNNSKDDVAVLQRRMWLALVGICSILRGGSVCKLSRVDGVTARGITHWCCAGVAAPLWLVWS